MSNLLPPTTVTQRAEVYRDLEQLVFPGFLSHTIWVGDIQWAMRSPCPRDWYMTEARSSGAEDPTIWQMWMIASCTWMVDGQVLLGESNSDFQVFRKLRDVHPRVLEIMRSVLMGLLARYDSALDMIEPYLYEDSSRYRWKSFGRRVPSTYSGIPVKDLGLNHPQQVWVAYNLSEDDRAHKRRGWENAKVVASTMAPKWARKLDKGDRESDEEESAFRQATKDRKYYEYVGLIEPGQGELLSERARPKTLEELEQEMQTALSGKKDSHDVFMEEYKQSIVQAVEEREQARRQRVLEARRLAEEEGDEEASLALEFVGYSQGDMNRIMANAPKRRVVEDAPAGMALLDRYLKNPTKVGRLQMDGDGNIVASERGTKRVEAQASSDSRVVLRTGKE